MMRSLAPVGWTVAFRTGELACKRAPCCRGRATRNYRKHDPGATSASYVDKPQMSNMIHSGIAVLRFYMMRDELRGKTLNLRWKTPNTPHRCGTRQKACT